MYQEYLPRFIFIFIFPFRCIRLEIYQVESCINDAEIEETRERPVITQLIWQRQGGRVGLNIGQI